MRKTFLAGMFSCAVLGSGYAQEIQQTNQTALVQAKFEVAQRGQNFQTLQKVTVTNENGQARSITNAYTILGTGMHYLTNGQWLKSTAEIKTNLSGAIAAEGPHKVQFAPDINTPGAVELTTSDNKTLRSHILGLAYYDFHQRKSVLIAELQSSTGELVGKNKLVYRDAFTDFRADVQYTYRADGMEQDVILRERPPLPQEFGFNPVTTRLLVLTEFLDPPVPKLEQNVRRGWKLDKVDRLIDFGAMMIVPGRAFGVGGPSERFKSVPVMKHWQKLDDRDFLVEEVDFRLLTDQLSKIPERAQASIQKSSKAVRHVVSKDLVLPARKIAATTSTKSIQVAALEKNEPGLILDYAILNVDTNDFTFQGDTTYQVTGALNLSGTTTIEGGTVVKFSSESVDPDSSLVILGPLKCLTKPYAPAVFTAVDDDSVGEVLGDSTGSPSGHYANVALSFWNPVTISNVRILYAVAGIYSYPSLDISDSQFMHCSYALQVDGTFAARNLLISDVDTAFYGHWFHGTVEHLTLDSANYLAYDWDFHFDYDCLGHPSSTLALTNSLLTGVGDFGTSPVSTNFVENLSSSSGVFQSVLGGSYYLADGTYRNGGTTNLEASMLADLAKKTTYPPIVYSNATISAITTLSPQAQRDTDTPDLGYHYDALDYIFGGSEADENVTFTAGTAVGWFRTESAWALGGQGIFIADNKKVTFDGTAENPNYWVRCNVVQEGNGEAWSYGTGGITGRAETSGDSPEVKLNFTHCSMLASDWSNYFHEDYGTNDGNPGAFAYIKIDAANSEFSGGSLHGYNPTTIYTNCLFERTPVIMSEGRPAGYLIAQNCTMWGGLVQVGRTWTNALVKLRDCIFDHTDFSVSDAYATNAVLSDYSYNAFLSGQSRTFPTNAHDRIVTNSFGWLTGALGNYYLPTNSTLLNVGSTNANLLTLYHFTTQTNQFKETNSVVDIGYHYVAVDLSGNPIDTNGDGTPDYLADANGNGLFDSPPEISWYHPYIRITAPSSNSIYAEPSTILIQTTASGGTSVITNVTFLRSAITLANVTNSPYQYTWPLATAGSYSLTAIVQALNGLSSTSTPVTLTVTNLCYP